VNFCRNASFMKENFRTAAPQNRFMIIIYSKRNGVLKKAVIMKQGGNNHEHLWNRCFNSGSMRGLSFDNAYG